MQAIDTDYYLLYFKFNNSETTALNFDLDISKLKKKNVSTNIKIGILHFRKRVCIATGSSLLSGTKNPKYSKI